MAAFCGCCGAEITSKRVESCPACGAPSHGTLREDPLPTIDGNQEVSRRKESDACDTENR